MLYRVRERAGFPDLDPDGETTDVHALRHTYCLREGSVDRGDAAVLMGHKSLSVTQRAYSRHERVAKRGAIARSPCSEIQPCHIRAS